MPRRKFGKLTATGAAAIGALALILIAGWFVDQRSSSEQDSRLADLARDAKEEPLALIERAAQSNRIVFLSDIHNAVAPKELAAQAIRRIAAGSGLDAVILEVGADQQPYIDLYLDRAPENASVLLSHPRTIREPGAATRAYFEIYHTIWQINEKLGPDERIRIIAADLPGWPDAGAVAMSESARKMGERSAHMQRAIDTQVMSTIPTARILVFMTGLHGLKTGTVALQTGGSAPVNVTPLASLLMASTDQVFTFLVDAPAAGATGREIAPYVGTRVSTVLDEAGVSRRFATPVTSAFDYMRHPIIEQKTPGIQFNIVPADYRLSAVADGYINLGK